MRLKTKPEPLFSGGASIGMIFALGAVALLILGSNATARAQGKTPSSYMPVVEDDFATVMKRMSADKPKLAKKQMSLLEMRYDLADHPAKGVTMSAQKKPI